MFLLLHCDLGFFFLSTLHKYIYFDDCGRVDSLMTLNYSIHSDSMATEQGQFSYAMT